MAPTIPSDKERAYFAMIEFLEAAWKRGDGITVADVLSVMHFLPDGSTFDPAYLTDWDVAWERSTGKTKTDYLMTLSK